MSLFIHYNLAQFVSEVFEGQRVLVCIVILQDSFVIFNIFPPLILVVL